MWLQNFRDSKGGLTAEGRRLQDNLTSPNGRVYLTQLIRREKTKQYLYKLAAGDDKTDKAEKADRTEQTAAQQSFLDTAAEPAVK